MLFSVLPGLGRLLLGEVGGRRERLMLLFGESELLRILERPDALVRLLRKKREQLVVHARVDLETATRPKRGPARRLSDVPGTDVKLLDLDRKEFLMSPWGVASDSSSTSRIFRI